MSIKRVTTKYIHKDEDGNLICYSCKEYKPETEYYDHPSESNTFYRNGKNRTCKSCTVKSVCRRTKESRKRGGLDRLLLERYLGAKERAKKSSKPFDINVGYLKELWTNQNGLCNISKIPMTFEMYKGRIPTNLSIDKIDGSLGYIKGNIQLVCMTVNQMKSDLSLSQLFYFCEQIVKNYEK